MKSMHMGLGFNELFFVGVNGLIAIFTLAFYVTVFIAAICIIKDYRERHRVKLNAEQEVSQEANQEIINNLSIDNIE